VAAVILRREPRAEWAREGAARLPGPPFLEHLLEVIVHPQIGVRRVVLGADAEPIAKSDSLKATKLYHAEWEKGHDLHQAALHSCAGHGGNLALLIDPR